jgi:hypothetical protein
VQIPDRFKLGAHTISVIKNQRLKDAVGMWYEDRKHIRLAKPKGAWGENYALQVFWHEAAHAITDTMGRHDLSEDEAFIDALAEYIVQLITTMEYDDGKGE